MHLLVTRAKADAEAMHGRLTAAGHRVTIEPLIGIEAIDAGPLDLTGVQAILATSRNALRCITGATNLDAARRLPLVAVGPGTAAEARRLGFSRVTTGPAAARDLPELIKAAFDPAIGALLHIAGETLAYDLAGDLHASGFHTRRQIVYRSLPLAHLSEATQLHLRDHAIDGVTLMSPRTASVYAELVVRHGLCEAVAPITHLCLSAAVAARLTLLGPVVIAVARQPNLEEMLALVATLAAQSRP